MKKFLSLLLVAVMILATLAFASCGKKPSSDDETTTFKIGIVNFVDDASLNQIVANIRSQLSEIETEKNVTFNILYQNCNTDQTLLEQIIQNFIEQEVDLLIGIATPVAIAMQTATEDNQIPVVFAAVSDPEGCDLVASNAAPGANITGTSDFLNTEAVLNIMCNTKTINKVGLLYDVGQDASTAPIEQAKAFFASKGISVVEKTATNTNEVIQASQALVDANVDAIFTPTDNTIMEAELSIYEIFQEAKIPHFTGADSFALNGAFLGYGVDYANLGKETGKMAADILLNNKNPGTVPVMTFDNGTATINTETAELLDLNFETLKAAYLAKGLATEVKSIQTAEEFDN